MFESPQGGDSNKYSKYMFYEEIRPKQDLSYISIYPFSILYNSIFILKGNVFWNKCCRCNEGSLYLVSKEVFVLSSSFFLSDSSGKLCFVTVVFPVLPRKRGCAS